MFEEELLEKTAVCTEILQDAKNELYLNMRFLDVALNSLSLQPTFEVSDYAVDGAVFYYEIPHLIEQYKIGNVMVNRAYLHSVFHCLFAHVFKEKREEKMLWDLACDIAVESVIDSLPVRGVCECPQDLTAGRFIMDYRKKSVFLPQRGFINC